MKIISLSLPEKQLEEIDKLSVKHGFENRSEFMRSLLRFAIKKPHIIEESSTFPFVSPQDKKISKIVSGFKKTGKYSNEFLIDLKSALESSDYFSR